MSEGFEIYEASVFIDVMGWNLVQGDGNTQLFSCGLRKEIKSSFNQRFIADYLVKDIDAEKFDALAIPGGFEIYGYYRDAYDETFIELIRQFRAGNKVIASVCVGALPLGKSGALQGKKGTTYHSDVRREALKSFGVHVVDEPIVSEDNLITSRNPSTAVEVAFLLLGQLTTKSNSEAVRQCMGF